MEQDTVCSAPMPGSRSSTCNSAQASHQVHERIRAQVRPRTAACGQDRRGDGRGAGGGLPPHVVRERRTRREHQPLARVGPPRRPSRARPSPRRPRRPPRRRRARRRCQPPRRRRAGRRPRPPPPRRRRLHGPISSGPTRSCPSPIGRRSSVGGFGTTTTINDVTDWKGGYVGVGTIDRDGACAAAGFFRSADGLHWERTFRAASGQDHTPTMCPRFVAKVGRWAHRARSGADLALERRHRLDRARQHEPALPVGTLRRRGAGRHGCRPERDGGDRAAQQHLRIARGVLRQRHPLDPDRPSRARRRRSPGTPRRTRTVSSSSAETASPMRPR